MRMTRTLPREVTQDELMEFLNLVTSNHPHSSTPEADGMVGAALKRTPSLAKLAKLLVKEAEKHGRMEIAPLAGMIVGFALGREFENRLMAKAMRGEHQNDFTYR